jgi:hypothetical protein
VDGGEQSVQNVGRGDGAADRLARHGWRSRFHDLATFAAGHGRATTDLGSGGYVTAERPRS